MKTGIALFVYNRPEHTKKVLEGLKKNNIKKLYIFFDGLKKEENRKSWEEVRGVIDDIDWCETEIAKSEKNKGLAASIVFGVRYVLNKHERIIILEDDCVPALNFIEFMEKCFDRYENEEKIMSVSGYSYPINIPNRYKYDIYFTHRACSWGWGTWKRAWKEFEIDYEILKRIKLSKEKTKILETVGSDLVDMLNQQVQGNIDSWAVFWALKIIENKGLCINPTKSLIKNIGFDGTGVNCGNHSKHDTIFFNEGIEKIEFPSSITCNDDLDNSLKELLMREENEDRYIIYYNMLQKWIDNLQLNKKIGDYVKERGINSVAIYGAGKIGVNVYEELKQESTIKVECFIDKYSDDAKLEYIDSVPIVSMDKFSKDYLLELIIVTPVYDFKKIHTEFKRINTAKKLVSLDDIIHSI